MWTELSRKRREERHESKERKQLLNFKARLTSTEGLIDWRLVFLFWLFFVSILLVSLLLFRTNSCYFSIWLPQELLWWKLGNGNGSGMDILSLHDFLPLYLLSVSISLLNMRVETRNTWINEIEKGERRQFASRCHLDSWQCYIPLHGCRVCCFCPSFSLCLSPRFDANYFMSNPGQKENRLKQEPSWEKNILGRRRDRLPISCHDNRICSERHKRDRLSFQTLSLSLFRLSFSLSLSSSCVSLVILSSSLLYYFASLSLCVMLLCPVFLLSSHRFFFSLSLLSL